jgi:hypothetical protein
VDGERRVEAPFSRVHDTANGLAPFPDLEPVNLSQYMNQAKISDGKPAGKMKPFRVFGA